jgi:hypothetical protein
MADGGGDFGGNGVAKGQGAHGESRDQVEDLHGEGSLVCGVVNLDEVAVTWKRQCVRACSRAWNVRRL